MKQDMIVILDLGSEENPRLAREIRALGVYSEIYPHDITLAELNALPNVKGIILNGGPNHVVDGVEIDACSDIYGCGLPLLQPGHKGGAPWPTDAAQRKAVLSEFVFDACGAQPNWNMENFIADQVELIRRQVGDKKVLLALSGGVDSSVVAALLIKAIGKQLVCVHVNHGLLRKGEPEQVVEVFRNQMDANLIYVDAVDRFLNKLSGVAEPEQKRKIIGAEFIRVFEEEARKLDGIHFLAQGTIYPDIIESGTKTVKAVKSHHNVGGLPEDLDFALVEPLKMLFKDEVRACGKALGLPDSMVYRQPFPGPGLGVRCLGAITRDRLEAVRESDAILREEEARKLDGIHFLAQGTIYPDIIESGTKTVKAVKSHHNVGGLPEDLDFALVEPLKMLFKDEVRACGKALGLPDSMVYRQPFPGPGLGVRCLGAITRDRLEAVRESDAILREEFAKAGLEGKVWQYFTVVPDFKSVGVHEGVRTFDWPVILRAVNTVDAMTATVEDVPFALLQKITQRITSEVKGVNRVLYDLTPKPSGTIEWE